MEKLDRAIRLIHLLCESAEGLTLNEMAHELGVNRRTAERMRDIVALHFDLEDVADGRTKRFRIREGLRRVYTRPSAAEVAALQAEVAARRREQAPQADLLEALLTKVRSAFDMRVRARGR